MGPHPDPEKSLKTGEACHICAAASGGPRYRLEQTQAERSSIQNALWLCTECSTRIDKDEASYPVQALLWITPEERRDEAASSEQWTNNDAMIFRLTHKLKTKIRTGALSTVRLDDNPFADWSANLFVADRTQYIIVSNTKSLYSAVLYGAGITNYSRFIERALSTIREFMEDDGLGFIYQRFVAPASASVCFAKALDRSITGSMNELTYIATACLVAGEMSPHDVGFRLNDILLSALGRLRPNDYGKPRDSFKALLAGRAGSRSQ